MQLNLNSCLLKNIFQTLLNQPQKTVPLHPNKKGRAEPNRSVNLKH